MDLGGPGPDGCISCPLTWSSEATDCRRQASSDAKLGESGSQGASERGHMYMSTDIRVVDFFPGRDPSIKVRGSTIKREWNV